MLIIPAIDLREGKCVRLTQGRADKATIYGDDPVDVARMFEQAGAHMLHVVDLDGAFSKANSPNRKLLGEIIRAVSIPVQFGGGIRTRRDARHVLELGASRIVIGTMAVESPTLLQNVLRQFAPAQIAVGIDARNGKIVTRGWLTEETIEAQSLARKVAGMGAMRIVYTDTLRDGTLSGPNIDQACLIAKASGLRVTASGGVSSLEDLRQLKAAGASGIDSVIIGKALYEGKFTLQQALRAVE
jgi:phosphoribosylformimino-5-aminoimidazole carboxamide ribotide isomerase